MNLTVTANSIARTRQLVDLADQGARALGNARGVLASNVPYAGYQEYGTRFMEGRFYATRARDEILPGLLATLAVAVWEGAQPVNRAITAGLLRWLARAQAYAPVDTGQLRASLFTKLETR